MSFKLNRRLYTDSSKTLVLEEGDERAAFVIGGPGSPVTDEDVKRYKLDDSHRLKEEAEGETEEAKAESPAALAAEPEVEVKADSSDLEALTVAQLKEVAAAEGVELTGASRKDDIISAIKAKRES